jgi:hypothetical protein
MREEQGWVESGHRATRPVIKGLRQLQPFGLDKGIKTNPLSRDGAFQQTTLGCGAICAIRSRIAQFLIARPAPFAKFAALNLEHYTGCPSILEICGN